MQSSQGKRYKKYYNDGSIHTFKVMGMCARQYMRQRQTRCSHDCVLDLLFDTSGYLIVRYATRMFVGIDIEICS